MALSLVLSLLLQVSNSPASGFVEGVVRASTGSPAAGVRVVARIAASLPGFQPQTTGDLNIGNARLTQDFALEVGTPQTLESPPLAVLHRVK